ncbi:MAG TPA: methyltransferase domain-containing protein [Phycisphaerales bacterium]|nr:methyltransferase domain-containing protein [Phycisphaerales bacterium]
MGEAAIQPGQSSSGQGAGERPRVDPNYQYWRDHGHEWVEHYDLRKTRMVLYHIQELMLTSYIEHHASAMAAREARPLRVLEFGCGVGRHLRNLSKLPNTDIHGYDQSRSMAEGALRWAERGWFDEHIHIGLPTGRLPFEDGAFDIVYSAEVLVHVRPEHLEGILSEMLRVSRGQVLHLETSPDFPLVSGEHSGCWRHDLPASYRRLGRECEVLARGYECHTPFRVVVGQPPVWTWPEQMIAMYRRLERDIDAGFTALDGSAATKDATIAAQTVQLAETTRKLAATSSELALTKSSLETEQGRKRYLEGENQALRGQYAEMSAARDAALAEVSALQNLLARVQAGWEADRAHVMQLLDQRRRFIEQVSRTLEGAGTPRDQGV